MNWLSDVRDNEAVKEENMLNVRDLGIPGRDFAILGGGDFGISLGVGHAVVLSLLIVILAIEVLGGIFSAFRLGKPLRASWAVATIGGLDEDTLCRETGWGRLPEVRDAFRPSPFM